MPSMLALLLIPVRALALFSSSDIPSDTVSAIDVSKPTNIVGNGTASSCTEDAFTQAVAQGGIITFNCGSSPYTLVLSSEKTITNDTVIDGGNLVTLSGGNNVRILSIKSSYDKNSPCLSVQNINFANGHTTDASNTTQGGAAIYRLGGTLNVINSTFTNNVGPVTGQDAAGGAIFSSGGGTTTIVGSVFKGNQASNGGAIGSLGSALTIVNSEVSGNTATGNGGNPGNGGNGGGIYIDGENSYFGTAVKLSGVKVNNNKGNAYGGGLMRVAYHSDTTTIDKSSFDGNSIPNQNASMAGGVYLQGTSITVTNSSVSNDTANAAGGMYIGPGSALNMTNVTVAKNTAATSLGGGLFIDNNVSGKILNSTIAYNQTPASVAFGAGIAGGNTNLSLGNSIVANNTVGNGYNPINCTQKLGNLGGNLQYPLTRQGGGSDDGALCSDGVMKADPLLGSLQDNGGPTLTIAPAQNSPAVHQSQNNCPTTDERGQPRQTPCTIGAYESP
jgi:hypothetical protein